ncbi:PadR family transcriptional regulator [Phycicoccus mangrovi]|uniref:PadR family transcriptional regulator n=1 Tax=Phycicoccus mangrovi TaxID=2840470 RepID=UPI0027E36A73|nr:PadR family transcriptional regulator [Phycicoccus mangrovi]
MPSLLGYALLGLLARRPSTGYDLARRMDRPVGYFWTARHSQIYPELARLESSALVEHVDIDGAGPRQTKRYSPTAAGLRALADWVITDPEPQPERDVEVLRLWSLWTAEPAQAAALVTTIRQRHLNRLAAYEAELAELQDDPTARDRGHPNFASRITLEGGVRARRATVEWLTWLLDEIGSP